jgi:uncharacterized cupredoxin-like copper-binding protein
VESVSEHDQKEFFMATTTDQREIETTAELEAELETVRSELESSRRRSGTTQLAALFALLLGIAALLGLAFKLDDNQNTVNAMHNQMSGNMAGTMGGAAPGGAVAKPSSGATTQVSADLGDYSVRPDMQSVPAGKVTFTATNVGAVPHELMVERAPIKMEGPGSPVEDAALGMIEDMEPGESGQMTVTLKPGMYVLFCNVPGHYAAGQHTMLRVSA